MVESGCISPLCEFLDHHDLRLVGISMEGLKNFMALESRQNSIDVRVIVESSGGLEKIENLVNHPNETISHFASRIQTSFFSGKKG